MRPLRGLQETRVATRESNPNRQLAIHTENVPLYEKIKTPGGPQVVRLVPREDVEKILAPNHGKKAAALRRFLRTEVYPKVFPELAAAALLCAFLIICRPVEKAKAAHHENR